MSEPTLPGALVNGGSSDPKNQWAILCCGCGAVLLPDGSLLNEGAGLVSSMLFKDLAIALAYASKDEADATALKHGWQIRDSLGPNHRCPKCVSRQTAGRGHYLSRAEVYQQ